VIAPRRGLEEHYWRISKEAGACRAVCAAVLERTLRDLYTYQDQRNPKRKKVYQDALRWVTDEQVPETVVMSFGWICLSLDLQPEQIRAQVLEFQQGNFQHLYEFLTEQRCPTRKTR